MKTRLLIAAAVVMLASALVVAHPHFSKTITAKLPSGVEVSITYQTTPANEMQAKNMAVGSFQSPRRPQLKLSADAKAGSATIPAGQYLIGVIKNSDADFTMALAPADTPRNAQPDAAKLIKLESMYSGSAGKADHMLIDIVPGAGKFEGRAVLTIHFGSMFLAGAVS